MTIAFDLALSPQLSARSSLGGAGLPAQPETGTDFATLIADRALLGAPTLAPTTAGDQAVWTRRAMPAPVALRFDQGPLFGRAFLPENLSVAGSPGDMAGSGSPGAQARFGPEWANDTVEPAGGRAASLADRNQPAPIVDKSVTLISEPQLSPVTVSTSVEQAAQALTLPDALNPAVVQPGLARDDLATRFKSISAQDGLSLVNVSAQVRPEVTQGLGMGALRGSAVGRASLDRGPEEGATGERNRQFRARFVDHLGPLQLTVRADGAVVQLTARVALASASVAGMLERRLRAVVAEEGHVLSRLQINGEIRPARARA